MNVHAKWYLANRPIITHIVQIRIDRNLGACYAVALQPARPAGWISKHRHLMFGNGIFIQQTANTVHLIMLAQCPFCCLPMNSSNTRTIQPNAASPSPGIC